MAPVCRSKGAYRGNLIIGDNLLSSQSRFHRFPLQALEQLLPPKKDDIDPLPEVVDEAQFEESDIVEVRSRSFPASQDFFDHAFPSQFGEDEDTWEDEDDEDDDHMHMGPEPECRPQ